jgi:Holliday junction resolvasome RuvABC endonuclease subunit
MEAARLTFIEAKPPLLYDIGVDPGARNVGVAASDDNAFRPHVIDLGPLERTSNSEIVSRLSDSIWPILADDRLENIYCEAGITNTFASKRQLISARLFLVQGALQALCETWNKKFFLVSPYAVKKRHWGDSWISGRTNEENKQESVRKCVELFGSNYTNTIHHACDAKLLAVWTKEHVSRRIEKL